MEKGAPGGVWLAGGDSAVVFTGPQVRGMGALGYFMLAFSAFGWLGACNEQQMCLSYLKMTQQSLPLPPLTHLRPRVAPVLLVLLVQLENLQNA